MTRARQSTPNKVSLYTSNHPEMESMGVAVDGRERIGLGPSTPGGPSKYFGNLNLSLAVYAPRKDLLEVSLEATARVAFAIRKTIQDEMTLEAIAARVAFIEAQVEVTKPHTTQRIVLEGDCRSTNWSKYDLTKFDFGFGDNVKSVHSIVGTKLIYGAGMLLIVKGSGGLVVASTVEKEADAMLEIDPLLRMYAELLPN
ncbi:hypothetical protein BDP27DRAFT_1414496 [Rhodocollybia butyracea]|uniref:Uncharacterized protein n=1 Tax=Rhodocollybia butyracea TaxID=206335 RepID=A0A9P5Q883_9AGAR|nr:hypothetical protein BDP27DRAFT_1414496 [Rhodocollybia butyracea]